MEKRGLLMRSVLTLLLSISVYGCASVTASNDLHGVFEAIDSQVVSCEFIGSMTATSPFYGVFSGRAIGDLREKLFASAGSAGATHIVFYNAAPRNGSTEMMARSYVCKDR